LKGKAAREGKMRFERAHIRSLGRKIRDLREARNWSLSHLSKNSGVSAAAIQKIEAGTSNPSLMTIAAIIDALGFSIDQLISDARQINRGVTVVRGMQSKRGSGTLLSSNLADRRMDCRVIAVSAHQKCEDVVIGKPLFGYVLDGGLRLKSGNGDSMELSIGDAFHAAAENSPDLSNPLSRRSLVFCINDLGAATSNSAGRAKRS
jgi:transcriptional regulator with XRE-family HTH domain